MAESGADLNAVGGPDEDTPLIVAVYYGYKSVVEVLVLEAGVEVNFRDGYGKTALYWARWANYRSIAKLLIDNGAIL